MDENFTSNNNKNDEFNKNVDEIDYKNLINVLKKISKTIALLGKNTLDKF